MINDLIQAYTDDEIAEHARTFRALVQSPGWALFCAFVGTHIGDVAREGHFDDEQPPGFYRGYLTACVDLTNAPEAMVAEADKRDREQQRDAEIRERTRLRQPIPEELREPEDDASRILRPKVWAGDEEDAHL